MKSSILPSLAARNALKKLGADISAARKRRKMTQGRLADGAGVAIPTIRRLENGDEGVSLATLAMVFVVLGEVPRLAKLLDPGVDDIGLMLGNDQLPKRIRPPRTSKSQKPPLGPTGPAASGSRDEDDIGEAF